MPGSKALLLSPQKPKITIGDFDFIKIDRLDYTAYSLFVLYKLHNFISTDYALIIQDDGWILNEKAWDKNFLNFDYIGAPTHLARHFANGNYFYQKNYQWTKQYAVDPDQFTIVLNGGFSLRSRRLLQMPEYRSLKYIIEPPSRASLSALTWNEESLLEDVQISLHMRSELERGGIKFPTIELAKRFSIEHLDLSFHNNLNLMEVFGHHSKFRKLTSLDPTTVEYQLAENQVHFLPGEDLIMQMFQRLGYRIKFLES